MKLVGWPKLPYHVSCRRSIRPAPAHAGVFGVEFKAKNEVGCVMRKTAFSWIPAEIRSYRALYKGEAIRKHSIGTTFAA